MRVLAVYGGLALALPAATLVVLYLLGMHWDEHIGYILVFLLLLFPVVNLLNTYGSRLSGRAAVTPVLLSVVIKLLASSIFLFFMLYQQPPRAALVVIVFLIYYAVFTAAEIFLQSVGRRG